VSSCYIYPCTCRRYYARYPGDVSKVKAVVRHLASLPRGGAPLPGGGLLTTRRFLQLGLCLGGSSGFETLHYLVDEAFESTTTSSSTAATDVNVSDASSDSASQQQQQLSYSFLRAVENAQSFETNPIYALLHESIYCEPGTGASNWAAERVLQEENSIKELFDYSHALHDSSSSSSGASGSSDSSEKPVYFTGEMVYSWMFRYSANMLICEVYVLCFFAELRALQPHKCLQYKCILKNSCKCCALQ
jgi:hypothetical protein